jgi:hypothetical protein
LAWAIFCERTIRTKKLASDYAHPQIAGVLGLFVFVLVAEVMDATHNFFTTCSFYIQPVPDASVSAKKAHVAG